MKARTSSEKNRVTSLANASHWISSVDGAQSLTRQVNSNWCRQVGLLPIWYYFNSPNPTPASQMNYQTHQIQQLNLKINKIDHNFTVSMK
jgi:hypothetical protein